MRDMRMASTSTLLPPMPLPAWLSRIWSRFAGVGRAAAHDRPVRMVATRPVAVSAMDPARSARFHSLMIPQFDAAYNFARYLSRDVDAADDIVQEAFLRAYRNFDGYLGGDARAWIFAIVRNCYHAWLQERGRKRRFEAALPEASRDEDGEWAGEIPSGDDTPEDILIRTSDSERVRSIIQGLPVDLREILVLRELEQLSYRQIADVIEVPIGTVMSRLARARREFGKCWRGADDDQEAPS